MKHFETTLTSKDGLQLFCQGWEPETEPDACICLIHGIGEHSGRYTDFAEYMTGRGFAVLSFDLRGHGRSQGPRGHTPSTEAILQDIDLLFKEADRRYPLIPRFLYGHSLGGMLVIYYSISRKPQVRGVIATSPALRTPLEDQKLKVALAKTLASIMPATSLPSGLDSNLISRDPEIVRAYQNDPLVHDRASFAMAASSFSAMKWVFERAGEFPVPLLLVHGTEDQLVDPSGSQDFAKLVSGDCTLELWEGLYHEPHNEPERLQVLEQISDWIHTKL